MAQITQIVKIGSAKRYQLYLDGEPALSIHEDVLVKYSLYKGMELDESEWSDLLLAEEENKIRQAALRYLSYRPRTCKQMEEYLLEKEFALERIQSVLQELQQLGYLDDKSFAVEWVRERKNKGFGNFRIQQELKAKGIRDEYISLALAETDWEEERRLAMEVAERRYSRIKNEPWQKIERKLSNFLLRRGFSWEVISSVLQEIRNYKGGNF